VTTIEPAAYPVPLSSLSTRRMCSTTGRVYCSATTKLKDYRNVTSPVCLHPMIRRRRRGNRRLIHSICQSEHPRLLPSSVYYPLHHILYVVRTCLLFAIPRNFQSTTAFHHFSLVLTLHLILFHIVTRIPTLTICQPLQLSLRFPQWRRLLATAPESVRDNTKRISTSQPRM